MWPHGCQVCTLLVSFAFEGRTAIRLRVPTLLALTRHVRQYGSSIFRGGVIRIHHSDSFAKSLTTFQKPIGMNAMQDVRRIEEKKTQQNCRISTISVKARKTLKIEAPFRHLNNASDKWFGYDHFTPIVSEPPWNGTLRFAKEHISCSKRRARG